MAYGLQTYQDPGRREDLIDILTDMSPDETPLMTMLGRSNATGTYHEWMEEYISRPTSAAQSIEGAAATYADLTQPSRRGNFTHIVTKTFRVSGTERAVNVAGMGDALDYQAAKALREWKLQAEYNLVNGTAASGSSGVARQMAGIVAAITTVATARNSGTSLSETEFNDMVQDNWGQVGTGNTFDLVLVPAGLKRKISGFTAGSTKNVDASDKRLTRPVDIYESDFGVHKIMAHHDVNNAAGTSHFLGIREDTFKVAYLREPFKEMLAKTGDREDGQIIGEFTLEYLAERASVKRTGYNLNG